MAQAKFARYRKALRDHKRGKQFVLPVERPETPATLKKARKQGEGLETHEMYLREVHDKEMERVSEQIEALEKEAAKFERLSSNQPVARRAPHAHTFCREGAGCCASLTFAAPQQLSSSG